jgi:undecaprenyl-diphosphatase|tara:strand:+ start:1286 stop:1834 length:549 start_codon:yes stop_codon:yes gene_type:complete
MIELLKHLDIFLFSLINNLGFKEIDVVMIILSHKLTFIPLYIFLLFKLYKYDKKNFFWLILTIILLIFLADYGSVHLFKNYFQRLRPCHFLDNIRLVSDCGGKFSFISSHAANMFSITFFVSLVLRKLNLFIFLFTISSIIGFSRIYLGVHYPFDIIGGMLWAIVVSLFSYKLFLIKINASI